MSQNSKSTAKTVGLAMVTRHRSAPMLPIYCARIEVCRFTMLRGAAHNERTGNTENRRISTYQKLCIP